MENKTKVLDLDFVFISYKEPNCEENYADLLNKVPWAKRVHGVKGFDTAHKAAADVAETDFFISIDGDNIIDESFSSFKDKEQFIFIVTSKGNGKKSSAYEYRVSNRGGFGVTGIKTSQKTGEVVDSFTVINTDEIILVTNGGKMIRIPIKDIRIVGRSTKGVSIFKIPLDEKIVSVTKANELSYE